MIPGFVGAKLESSGFGSDPGAELRSPIRSWFDCRKTWPSRRPAHKATNSFRDLEQHLSGQHSASAAFKRSDLASDYICATRRCHAGIEKYS